MKKLLGLMIAALVPVLFAETPQLSESDRALEYFRIARDLYQDAPQVRSYGLSRAKYLEVQVESKEGRYLIMLPGSDRAYEVNRETVHRFYNAYRVSTGNAQEESSRTYRYSFTLPALTAPEGLQEIGKAKADEQREAILRQIREFCRQYGEMEADCIPARPAA